MDMPKISLTCLSPNKVGGDLHLFLSGNSEDRRLYINQEFGPGSIPQHVVSFNAHHVLLTFLSIL